MVGAAIFVCSVSPKKHKPKAFFDVVVKAHDGVANATTWPPASGCPSGRRRFATNAGNNAALAASKRSHHADCPQPEGWCSHRFSGAGPPFVRLLKLSSARRKASTKETPQRRKSLTSTGVSTGRDSEPPAAERTNSKTRTTPSCAPSGSAPCVRETCSPCNPQCGNSSRSPSDNCVVAILCTVHNCGSKFTPQASSCRGTSAAPCPKASTATAKNSARTASDGQDTYCAANEATGTTRELPSAPLPTFMSIMPRAVS
mmetsp:Transcript_97171/g.279709  ORF Transcript_97171/g.279709 Transcript_97171/m.279709 type:complete len:258 (-) Transcript_97171:149-922(-)